MGVLEYFNSNTTIVSINPITSITMAKCQKYSNTTIVSINPKLQVDYGFSTQFKYNYCFY